MNHRCDQSVRRGLTLIEVLVVISILGILFAITSINLVDRAPVDLIIGTTCGCDRLQQAAESLTHS